MTRMQKRVLLAGLLCMIGTKCADNLKKSGLVIHVEIAPAIVEPAETEQAADETEPVIERTVVTF